MARTLAEATEEMPDAADVRQIKELQKQLRTEQERRKRAEASAKEYERLTETLQDQIETQASKLFRLPKGMAVRGKTWHRVIIPDSHGSSIDRKAAAAFLRDLRLLNPRQIIWIGDHLECGGFLAQHWTLGFVAQTGYTFAQDIADTNDFLDRVTDAAPNATQEMLEGNHEGRIEQWCVTQSLKSHADATVLLATLSAPAVLHLDRRGVAFHRRSEMHDGLKIRGTIRRGECHFTHGTITAKRAAAAMLARYGSNIIFGHTHRIDQVIEKLLDRILVSASIGCLSELQPMWRHSDPTTWSHGYGLQICRANGEFLHITVPIIDGRSLLGPLIGVVK